MEGTAKNLLEGLSTGNVVGECIKETENGIQKIAYSVAEAAEAIGVSRTFLYVYLGENPDFPRVRLGTRIIIPKKRLEEFINSQCGG